MEGAGEGFSMTSRCWGMQRTLSYGRFGEGIKACACPDNGLAFTFLPAPVACLGRRRLIGSEMSPLLTTMKERVSPIWKSAVHQLDRGLQWIRRRQQAAFMSAGICIVLLLLLFSGVTAAVAAVAAWIALIRHFAQTEADRHRRITESFSKAVEQLSSEKIEVRLGGIYALERISRESPTDYWPIMATLSAFVRERARWKDTGGGIPETHGDGYEVHWEVMEEFAEHTRRRFHDRKITPWDFDSRSYKRSGRGRHRLPTDIEAILAVIRRRTESDRNRENQEGWRFDLSGADLRGASLQFIHLEGASLMGVHLEDTFLWGAYLQGASLLGCHLEGALLGGAHLESALLWGAYLEGASLTDARLDHSFLSKAHLEGTDLADAYLEGAILDGAFGDARTRLPTSVRRPAEWPAAAPLSRFG